MCRIQDCDPWDLYHAKQRTARKPHKCMECGRVIAKGERYHHASGLAEGRFDVFKLCEHCDAAADWLTEVCNGYIYGDIGEELEEHWDEDTAFRSRELAEAIIGRIHADFGDVFAVQRTAQIFELAPRGSNEWTATIGLPQNLLYRVHGVGDLSQPPCLFTLEGQQVRCGPAAGVNGAGPGVAVGGLPSAPTVPGVAPAPADSDLSKLSDAQLTDLLTRASAESGRRLAGHGGP